MMAHETEKQKMLRGELYNATDPQLTRERQRAKALCRRYNQAVEDLDRALLHELFGGATDAYLESPFFCDYGYNIRLGARLYANHNLVILDCAEVTLGDDVLIGPNVVISTAGHPLDGAVRRSGLEFAKPIRIGSGVWIGASVTVLPGVEIGENAIIGAGSVVTRSIPAGAVAFGNPCQVRRV
ncbi:MAG TPA: sugar O-acetyltransferase [Vicinamibacterales bacterium]|nr:sugar O-acetyltransferase [Vicinamibacterales bacterium]